MDIERKNDLFEGEIGMPRTEEQYEAMRQASKAKIHASAITLFSKKGLLGTSVQDIAKNAEISIGLMYRHYKKKEDLFNELVLIAAQGLEQTIDLFQKDLEPKQIINQFSTDILSDLQRGDEAINFYLMMNQAVLLEERTPQIDALVEKSDGLMRSAEQVILKGQQLGQFVQKDVSELTTYYLSTIHGLCMSKQLLKEKFKAPSLETFTRFLYLEQP